MIQRNPNIEPDTLSPPKRPAAVGTHSLEGLHGSVSVPSPDAGFWKHYKAFVGPALLVSVGYMDPGNWATDLGAGAQFKYGLLWIVGLASLMAMVLQVISARMGVVMGKDLAQACRDHFPAWTRWPNWIGCELAIGACDLAEVLGSALAIHLLFPRVSLLWAVAITAFDVLLLLGLQRLGMRTIEAVIVTLIATIGGCYFIEIFVLPATQPNFLEMGRALVTPELHGAPMLMLAIGIIGATVMPHNLYLHSALVQSRRVQSDEHSMRKAVQFNTIDSAVALTMAFVINAAILVMAAMVFFGKESVPLPGGGVYPLTGADWISDAYLTLAPLLGTAAASVLFAVALFASGQSSTMTGTLAGQVVMEGFLHLRIRPWIRRLLTRGLAITPAILLVGLRGEQGSVNELLVWSQIVLAIQLPFAMLPLLYFTSRRRFMGRFTNGWFLLVAGWGSAIFITAMDAYWLYTQLAPPVSPAQ